MTPPAALVIGSVVVVAGATFAFHQLIYEPHIAPKLEVLIENWFHDRRLRRRRLAPAVRVAENGVQARLKGTPPALEATEMETLTKAVKASGVETFIIDVPYERRKKPSRTHEHSVLEAPNSFIPFSALTPDANVKSDAKDTTNAALYSITSTPSTFSASLSGLQSPFSQHDSLTAVNADHSRANIDDPLADSVLSESRGFPFYYAHISSRIIHRTLFAAL
ncbi:hypothetical protein FRC15_012043 [Serendipita sp. 397]|nr:hypothetical protein FRC15_012043 [Serendipita sp. 397]